MFEKIKNFKIVNNKEECIPHDFLNGYLSCDFKIDDKENYIFDFTFPLLYNHGEYLQSLRYFKNFGEYLVMTNESVEPSGVDKRYWKVKAFRIYKFTIKEMKYYTTDNMNKGHICLKCSWMHMEQFNDDFDKFDEVNQEFSSQAKWDDVFKDLVKV